MENLLEPNMHLIKTKKKERDLTQEGATTNKGAAFPLTSSSRWQRASFFFPLHFSCSILPQKAVVIMIDDMIGADRESVPIHPGIRHVDT